jgi:hypothetical protein
MKPVRIAAALALATVLSAASLLHAQQVEHPRLFVTQQRIAEIRKAIQVAGSTHAQAYQLLRKRVDSQSLETYGGGKYARSYAAREAAMVSLLATEPAEKKKYADLAFGYIQGVYNDRSQKVTAAKGYGLARAMMSLGLAIPYDWCYPTWTPAQREYVEGKIDQALDAWPGFRHVNVSGQYASNWAAVTRGGELVLMLARGAEKDRAKRYNYIKGNLLRHMTFGFGDLGVSQEGVGYTEYPGGFLLPACYAAESIGDDELVRKARSIGWSKLAMYSHSFQGRERKFIQTGVAHTSNFNEGWLSLLLHHAGDDHLPYYLWFYDRAMGVKSAMDPDVRFDGERAGTLWALIYYPTDVQAVDPTGKMPAAVGDQRGYYFFRNRWKDANDIQTSIMADHVHHRRAWDQPENLAINLLSHNARFIGGPGKGRDSESYSTLLIDGKYNVRKATDLTGKTVKFAPKAKGGLAIIDGGALYRKLGVSQARRQMLVRFSDPEGNAAVVSTLDRIEADDNHTYTWQVNLGSDRDDGDIQITKGSESGRPQFQMKGGNGVVTGWVVSPAEAKITSTTDPMQIEVTGSDADIWIVLFVGKTDEPKVSFTGTGLETKVKIYNLHLQFDADEGELVSD